MQKNEPFYITYFIEFYHNIEIATNISLKPPEFNGSTAININR